MLPGVWRYTLSVRPAQGAPEEEEEEGDEESTSVEAGRERGGEKVLVGEEYTGVEEEAGLHELVEGALYVRGEVVGLGGA
uniref:Uncharacterized protein n=1 Tax=Chromera velia CCMP2878 TaxID=1169474 RepID=A0A0G4IAX0_9ALVE|eukprot:Cvel_2118.t1-p1 / transcript=Cvel_2118.t1 / gene=Cvel_2118 / organism=Chromera_velia_CCMP2878 / gene_product=hypothetical protein / transcript_product=hypothetical protein / location=Cvel_scaffold82:8618-8854(-) / protein_length=79 / sequence_SO=supercontig / SO=protein_coding / is_pseudo=false